MIFSFTQSLLRPQHAPSQSPTDMSRLPPLPTREPLVSHRCLFFGYIMVLAVCVCLRELTISITVIKTKICYVSY